MNLDKNNISTLGRKRKRKRLKAGNNKMKRIKKVKQKMGRTEGPACITTVLMILLHFCLIGI